MGELVVVVGAAIVAVGAAVETILASELLTLLTLNLISSKLFGPKIPDSLNSLRAKSVTVKSGIEYRTLVYGQAAVSGPVVYHNTSGTNREYLWTAVALADGPIEDVVEFWMDGDVIPKADISWAAGSSGADGAGTGNVSTTAFIGDNSAAAAQIYYTLGHPDQVAMSKMTSEFSDWTTNHRLRGISYAVFRLLYNEDTEKVWERGAPRNYKAVIKGRKVYDPRKDSTVIIDPTTSPVTYGSGSQRYTDSSTWKWSDNPALCVADYLFNFMDVPAATAIDWPSFAAAADDCDVLVAVPPAASPENTEKRFTCNGVISLGTSHKDNLDNLISSCDGKLSYAGGVWKLRASVWEASSVSFDESDLAGDVEVRGSAPKSERMNTVRGVFVNPDRDYEPDEFPHVTNSTYLTRDNNVVIEYDLELPMTNSATMAQRIAFRLIEQGNNQIVARIKTNARGMKCTVGDVVSLTVSKLSWTSKTFRVIEWQRNVDGTVDLSLREDASASYDDPLVAEYTEGNSGDVTVPTDVVPPPTSFSASSVPYGIFLSWTNPAATEYDFIDVYCSDDSSWSNASLLVSVRADTYTYSVGSGTQKYFWLRARRNSGDVSVRVPNSDTSTVTATAGAGTDSVNIAGATLSDQQVAATTEVGYQLTSGGQEESYEGVPASPTVWDTVSTWLLSGAAGDYFVELTKTSGTDPTSGPALATRHQLSTTRTWIWTDSTQDDSAVTFEGTVTLYDNSSPQAVLGSANLSVTIDSQTQTITLSGTSGSPNTAIGFAVSPTDAESGWRFNSDGSVDRNEDGVYTQFAAGVEWNEATPVGNYYLRATNDSGDNPTSGTLGTWQLMNVDIEYTWTETGTAQTDGTIKVEIAADTSPIGSTILATGYYKGDSTVSTV